MDICGLTYGVLGSSPKTAFGSAGSLPSFGQLILSVAGANIDDVPILIVEHGGTDRQGKDVALLEIHSLGVRDRNDGNGTQQFILFEFHEVDEEGKPIVEEA